MFSFCHVHVLQINSLLPFFDVSSGTHLRPCVQVATPLVGRYMVATPLLALVEVAYSLSQQ